MPRTHSLAWSELKIGILSVVAIVLAAILIFMVSGEGGFFWQRYAVKTTFKDIAGLKEGAPVRVAGVEVGSVTMLAFNGDSVEVTMEVGKEQRSRITDKSVASLGSVSLLGEAAVDITAAVSGTPVADWGYVTSGPAPGSIASVAEQATASLEQTSRMLKDVGSGKGTLGKLVTDDALYKRLDSVTARLDTVLQNLNDGQGTAGQLLHDKQLYENMNQTIADMRGLIAEIKKDPKKYLNVKVSIF